MKFPDYDYGKWKFNKDDIEERWDRVDNTLRKLREHNIIFDGVVVHGTSGTWLAPLLTMKRYDVVLVRKPDEYSHGSIIEGPSGVKHSFQRLVTVDDLICSGKSIRRVRDLLANYGVDDDIHAEIVAVVLHDQMYEKDQTVSGIPYQVYRCLAGLTVTTRTP